MECNQIQVHSFLMASVIDPSPRKCGLSADKVDSSPHKCGLSADKVDSPPRECTNQPLIIQN
ncbi:MAG: hypothetical protein HN692_06580 [Candidatus Cloacimonetes bacterium]|jgi:hypothetical protein|nr:hypothetical protein [Candidatus Cloacimonadota bacterium]